ncbi:MAG: DUF885 family protein [Desulfobaccales bacterium]
MSSLPGSLGPSEPALPALTGLAGEFFRFLAREFPTLCRHDEFMFFPRAAVPPEDWWRVPRLEAAAIQAAAAQVADWETRLTALLPDIKAPALAGEAALLRHSLRSVLRELGPAGPWARDPFFYLKVAALAWAPVLAGTPRLAKGDEEKLGELLSQVGRLFTWAAGQIQTLNLPTRLLGAGAFADARQFFDEVLPGFLATLGFPGKSLLWRLSEASQKLRQLWEKVSALPAKASYSRGEEGLSDILTQSWGWDQGLDAAAAILEKEIAASQAALARAAQDLSPGLSWAEAMTGLPLPKDRGDLLDLYRREIKRLWAFWEHSPVLPPPRGRVEVAATPLYLRSLRSSASYAAAWGQPEETPGYFYVSPDLEDRAHHLRHCPFLSAHETVPGHHFLDTWRISLPGMVARQYESPFYYEGWACYAETLLLSEGYLEQKPGNLLVGWQRRLWRALRGQVDLELHRGRWDLEEGCRRLAQAGYPADAARLQVLQLALNPGYQLCYTLGLREVLRLREQYKPLGLARFHEILLGGGQLPFTWVEKRLKAAAG